MLAMRHKKIMGFVVLNNAFLQGCAAAQNCRQASVGFGTSDEIAPAEIKKEGRSARNLIHPCRNISAANNEVT